MYVSHKAIDRPRVVLVGVLMVVMLALMAAINIPVQRTPAINTAVILVQVVYPGAQPSEAEEQITRKIEEALQRLNDVDFISSTSMRGASVTQVMFLDGIDSKRARDDVAHLVDEVRSELPVGREIQPIITEIDFESMPIMLVSMKGPPGFDPGTLKELAEDVQEDLEGIQGVANTQLFGGREREIHVNVIPDLFAQYNLDIGDVRGALMSYHAELPGGALNTSKFDLQIRNETKLRNVDDIADVVVAHRDGRLIRLRDIATVEDTYRRRKSVAQLDGRETASIIVYKEANINSLGTASALQNRVEELRDQYPHIEFSATRDVSEEISEMFYVLGSSAVFGAILILVILSAVMGMRISILVLIAVPFSTAIGLIALYVSGIAISGMVLFSFILVLGMVVDGAIIVAENIHRHIERGEPPVIAAKTGIDEVGIPVIAADLTTMAAFAPMLLVPGMMGDFMGVMPKVVTAALIGSVLVDHFIIPVVAAYWYRQREPKELLHAEHLTGGGDGNGEDEATGESRLRADLGPFTRLYARALRYSLENRWVIIVVCVVAIFWAVVMLRAIKKEFFPKSDIGQFEINYELPLGYSIEETVRAAEVFTEPLLELPKDELEHFVTAVGSSAGLATRLENDPATGPEFGKVMVELTPPTVRSKDRHQTVIIEELRKKIKPWPGMIYRIEEVEEGPPGGADVAVRLTGKDLEQLGRVGAKLADRLRRIDGTIDVTSDYRPDSPELVVEPHPELLGLFGMSDTMVARAVQTAILGDSTIQLNIGDEDVTLRLQAAPEYQRGIEDVSRLMLTSPSGAKATVGQLADVRLDTGLYAIRRYERSRAVTIRCNVRPGASPDDIFNVLREEVLPEFGFRPLAVAPTTIIGQVKALLVDLGMTAFRPPAIAFAGSPVTDVDGVRATFTGENEERDENMEYMFGVMIVGVVLIFTVLVIQFNSVRQTVIVLMAVPLSFVGVVFGMWVCRHLFSLATFIGLVALAGIVVNDAIVLVDFTNQARRRGLGLKEALMEAGINRLRPVLLTTVTTIGGLLPLFLNFSGGAEFWAPLTGAVIFGLAFATMLTLIVIPVCYSLAYSLPAWKRLQSANGFGTIVEVEKKASDE
jgi:multidrug efflux pump subunit AcrB